MQPTLLTESASTVDSLHLDQRTLGQIHRQSNPASIHVLDDLAVESLPQEFIEANQNQSTQ